ncbi:hypothetical protein Cri9333_4895 (plasmid) [Crinalium epipsammum PCC 9333]|uniref:Uncharacterized protein n=1 Tax=Crinalium epipsammum PCC 9333 TaxID=1173022 RepID=K9W7D9_9CYAN|nr:hypothetical protein [Crinalium epipsammum]AFZ15657.1 hypothetical protein Cri9333_4895 [Crinalium epipsammum PCC 9333]
MDYTTRFNPSEDALLYWLRERVDRSMLEEIAMADYSYNYELHLSALLKVHQGEALPVPIPWEPREVLELTRWSEPDDLYIEKYKVSKSFNKGSKGIPGHLIRAFACTLLLRAVVEPENRNSFDGENSTIVQLVSSAIHLGQDAATATVRFLAWCVEQVPHHYETERPFYVMGILLLEVFLATDKKKKNSKKKKNAKETYCESLLLLCDWVMDEEAKVRNNDNVPSSDWLLGLTFFDIKHDTWKLLTRQLLIEPIVPHSKKTVEILELIGLSLLES